MKRLLEPKFFVVLALLYTGFLTWGSLATIPTTTTTIALSDKFLHFVAYFGLSILWGVLGSIILFKKRSFRTTATPLFLKIGSVLIIYGILIEGLQAWFTTNRMADVWDVVANIIGVLLGLFFVFAVAKKRWQTDTKF